MKVLLCGRVSTHMQEAMGYTPQQRILSIIVHKVRSYTVSRHMPIICSW